MTLIYYDEYKQVICVDNRKFRILCMAGGMKNFKEKKLMIY